MPHDFTLSNARRFYSSKGNPLGVKGLTNKLLNLPFFQCRLIVSTMASQQCQAVNAMFYPLFIWVLIVPFVRSTELEVGILIFYTAAVAVCHIHYGVFLVSKTHAALAVRKQYY